jgi:hypothetical protein
MDRRAALLFVSVLLVSAGCLGTADETETPPYGESATIAEILEGHDENEFQGYRYTLSVRDTETGELRRESTVSIDYADGEMLVEEENIDDNSAIGPRRTSSATYVNLSSGVRYDRELDRPEKVDADKVVNQSLLPSIVGSISVNETLLTLEDTHEEAIFSYSTDSVTAEVVEVTNMSVSLTAEGFIRRLSIISDGFEYTAEFKKGGDVGVETPDWVDTDEAPRSFGAVSVEQKSGEITFVLIDPGSLDEIHLKGPGGASVSHGDLVVPGNVLRVRDGGFSKEEVSGGFVTPNDDECIIQHGRSEVAGQTVNLADIPCDGSGIEGLNGDDIRYETGAEYRIVGVVDGEEALIKSVSTQDE